MSECKVVLLSDRAVLRVTGEAARNFLQGLITNHIDKAKPGSAIHTGLLTPQGKILVDFFVLPVSDGFLLELAKDETGRSHPAADDLQAPHPGRVRRGAVARGRRVVGIDAAPAGGRYRLCRSAAA